MWKTALVILMLGGALLFMAACSQSEHASPVAPVMGDSAEKSMADTSSEIEMGRDVSDLESAMGLMGLAVAPIDMTVLYGEDHTVSAKVYLGGDPSAYPVAGQMVTFEVIGGPNAGTTATMATDGSGQASFTYIGEGGLGMDRIEVASRHPMTGETIFDTITVTWMSENPTLEARPVPLYVNQDNHKYITITPDMVITRAEDVYGDPVDLGAVTVLSVSSDEPEDHIGDGSTVEDIMIECPSTVMLRTERMGGDEGRVYTIRYRLTDASGRTTDDSMMVIVVKDGSGNDPVAPSRHGGYTVSAECEGRSLHINDPF